MALTGDVTASLDATQFILLCEGIAHMLACFPRVPLRSQWQDLPEGPCLLTLAQVPAGAAVDPQAALAAFDAWWLTQCHRDTTGMVFDYACT